MLKRKLGIAVAVMLILSFLIPAYISFVSSSSGYIRVNATSTSVPNPQVTAGANVSLYFGDVTWNEDHMFLFLSHDLNPRLSYGDFVYSPQFEVVNLTDTTSIHPYFSSNGFWLVGSNWINGSIIPTVPLGNYTIKAIDDVSGPAAVTDTYILVSPNNPATLQISPSSGPGGVSVEFTGSDYDPYANVVISYYDSTFGTWNYFDYVTATQSGTIAFSADIPDLRQSLGIGDYSESYTALSFRAEVDGFVQAYADYNQYSRGLKQVGNQIASGLFGNGTNLVSTVGVEKDEVITISGKWFHPGDVIYVRWDGYNVVGTVTGSEWLSANIIGSSIADPSGYFEATVTIPDAEAGEHYIAVEDSETRVIVKVFMSRGGLQISPSSGPGGVSVEFTGSDYDAYDDVTISYYDPTFGTWNAYGSTTANALGNIVFATEMPDLRASIGSYESSDTYTSISFRTESNGVVHSYADYNQYARGLNQVDSFFTTGLIGNGTNLVSTVSVDAADSIVISGKWFHSSSVIYVRWDSETVVGTLTTDEWQDSAIIGTSIADSSGSFITNVTIPIAQVGEHYIAVEDSETIVIIKINLASSPAPSPTPTPTATPEPTPTPTPTPEPTPTPSPTPSPTKLTPTIDVSCKSISTSTDLKVEIAGKLTYNGGAISGEQVLISYSVTGGDEWESLTSVNTGSDGSFVVVWTPIATGDNLVKARWAGNASFNEASKTVNLALAPYSEQTMFSLNSNSTITAFAFNSTTQTLSFTASGPQYTQGYVTLYIPKTLITDISELKIYLDETQIAYNTESQTDSWVLSFTYAHSTHKIVIDLTAASSETNETQTPDITTYLIITLAAIAIAAFAVTLIFKRKHQTPTKQQ